MLCPDLYSWYTTKSPWLLFVSSVSNREFFSILFMGDERDIQIWNKVSESFRSRKQGPARVHGEICAFASVERLE